MEKPILFSTEMVRAILDGRKTQTRRVIKPQPPADISKLIGPEWYEPAITDRYGELKEGKPIFGAYDEWGEYGVKCPYQLGRKLTTKPTTAGWYDVKWEPGDEWKRVWVFEGGQCWGNGPSDDPEGVELDIFNPALTEWRTPGTLLWVRETWQDISIIPHIVNSFTYKADWRPDCVLKSGKWRPSIHMPREAARLFLTVKDIRVERLQEITEEDVAAEGTRDGEKYIEPLGSDVAPWHIACFEALWNSTLKEKKTGPLSPYRFCFNPWVFVIEFERSE